MESEPGHINPPEPGGDHDALERTAVDRKLLFSIVLNSLIVVVEVAGGVIAGSLALLSDAMHNASDVVSLVLAFAARVAGRRAPSARHTYGLARVEVLTALANGATLLVVATLIGREAFVRILHPEPVKAGIMFWVALVGLVANLASVLLLRGHSHGDLNLRAAFLHLIQDTLSSVAVVLAALFAGFRFGAYLDPAVSILVLLVVLRGGWKLIGEALRILLEGAPPGMDTRALQHDIQERFPIRNLHHLHVWELNSGVRLLTAHVRVHDMPTGELESLLAQIHERLRTRWAVAHATLEPEIEGCGSDALVAQHALSRRHGTSPQG